MLQPSIIKLVDNEIDSSDIILENPLKLLSAEGTNLIRFNITISNSNYQAIEKESYDIKNRISTTKFVDSYCAGLLNIGKLMHIESKTLSFYGDLSNISLISTSGKYIAVVSEEATLFIKGPSLKYSIPFYGDSICCCSISDTFGIVICGTNSGKIVICSLSEGKIINILKLEGKIKPKKILITPSWGFILVHATGNESWNGINSIFLYTINGKLIRSKTNVQNISCWSSFTSNDGFDYIILSEENGKLFIFEAYYLEFTQPFHRCYCDLVDIRYYFKYFLAIAVRKDGQISFIPYILK